MRHARWWLAGLMVVIGGAVFFLNSMWLQDFARTQVVSALEFATGSSVAIRDFHFDWKTLTIECKGVKTRSATIQFLKIALRWQSLWKKRVDAARILVDGPDIELDKVDTRRLALPDVFAIQVGRYEIKHGMLHFRAQQHGFELRGEELRAELMQSGSGDTYGFDAAGKRIAFQSDCCGGLYADVSASGTLGRHALALSRWHAQVNGNRDEQLTLDGKGSYSAGTGFMADGTAKGVLSEAKGEARFYYTAGELALHNISAQIFGGRFHGDGKVRLDRSWEFAGMAEAIALGEAAKSRDWQIPWNARASGPVSGTSAAGFEGDLRISGGLTGDARFRVTRAGEIDFGKSHIQLAHSAADFSGSERSGLSITVETRDLVEARKALAAAKMLPVPNGALEFLPGGAAQFAGTVRFEKTQPVIAGTLSMQRFRAYHRDWEHLEWKGEAARDRITAETFELTGAGLRISGAGQMALRNWTVLNSSEIFAKGTFALAGWDLGLPVRGSLSGSGEIKGTIGKPEGQGSVRIDDGEVFSERVKQMRASVTFVDHDVRVSQGRLQDASGNHLDFSGSYLGQRLDLQLRTHRFVLSRVSGIKGVDGKLAIDLSIAADVAPRLLRPIAVDGTAALTDGTLSGTKLGDAAARIKTENGSVRIDVNGTFRGSEFSGEGLVGLEESNPIRASLRFSRIDCENCLPANIPVRVTAGGSVNLGGNLRDWRNWTVQARAEKLELAAKSFPFALHSTAPAQFELSDGSVTIRHLELAGPDTTLRISGAASQKRLNITADGELTLKILQMFDSNVETAQGKAFLHASAHGTFGKPVLGGTMQIKDGALGLRDFANGLTELNGSVVFDQDRATIQSLTAKAGGGKLSLIGFVTFGGTAPLAYHLESHAEDTRLRYANGVSATANANLRLTGTSTNSLLSGVARISRVVLNPNADVGNLLTNLAAGALTPANRKAFASGLQFDVAIDSAPNLQISTSLSRDVEAAINLRLRGTPDRPVLLGTVTANQGDIRVFGGRYTINRGEVTFQNAASVEPVLDLDLQTQARGINVDITIAGTFNRLNISYRSDPPLQPRDIIALLTVGRTPQEAANVQTSQVTSENSALAANPGSILGQAITPPSGRLSKLFGVTNIKLDPLVQGLTNTPQSRLTLEQQISRAITVTYVTNLEQTSEQIFRLEWSINRQYSIVAVRDDNGEFGIDFQYKKRFK